MLVTLLFLSVVQVQPNSYCTFYDDQRQNWSIMFESEKASSDFCKEVNDIGHNLEARGYTPSGLRAACALLFIRR